jgi:Flp pilus assembly secretin CpaC
MNDRAWLGITLLLVVIGAGKATAQVPAQPEPELIALARGSSELLPMTNDVTRVAIGDSSIANVIVVSAREILINAAGLGSTNLIVWESTGGTRRFAIEVSVDAAALNRQFATLFPSEAIRATAHGNVVVLSGTVSGGEVARRMVEIARATGATVVQNYACLRPSTTC